MEMIELLVKHIRQFDQAAQHTEKLQLLLLKMKDNVSINGIRKGFAPAIRDCFVVLV
jgi:hypothetical protein